MKAAIRIALQALFLVLMVFAGARTMAQENKPLKEEAPKYDPSNQTTLQGKVQEIKEYSCPITGTVGTHLSVASNDGGAAVEVHVAPAAFVKQLGILIKPGDEIKVVGVRTVFDGKPAMLAKTIILARTLNKEIYTDEFNFRDDKGRPIW